MRPLDEYLTQPGGLAVRLYGLRKAAGLGVGELASQLGWVPSKVSKIQRGRQRPTVEDITAWAKQCGHPEAASELLDLLARAETVHWHWDQRLARGGQAAAQEDLDRQTRQATRIRSVQVAVLTGLLQTPDYARHTITMFRRLRDAPLDDVEATVSARMRRQEVLYEPGRTFEFVITENVLRRRAGGTAVMLGQLDRLAQLSGLANITLGILPDDAGGLEIFPYEGFLMLDGRVSMDLLSGEARFTPGDTAAYGRMADAALAASVTGEGARRLIMAAAAALRASP